MYEKHKFSDIVDKNRANTGIISMKKTIRFPKKKCTDHLGKEYPSIKEMCSHWGIQPETYTRRIKVYHLSVEEALTHPVKPNGGQACRDHQGTRFRSRTLMCEHWNMDRKLFEYRISHGWSLEDALTKPRRGA